MNVCVLSAGPIFQNYVHGGSQKILRNILLGLSSSDKVTVLCVARRDLEPFKINENIKVLPVLTYRETYPNPLNTSPLRIANLSAMVYKYTRNADVIYNHDSQMIFRVNTRGIPSVISCRDVIYPETIVGLLVNQEDSIIVNSAYAEACIIALLKRQKMSGKVRIRKIENGIDIEHFYPISDNFKSDLFPQVYPKDFYLIISPGRAEVSKGHHEALELLGMLTGAGLPKPVFLGIPRYIDINIDTELKHYYNKLEAHAKELGIWDNIIFHDWMPYEQMPKLYAAADLVLGLGSYPECFGNTYLEAVCCGTPCVIASVGANRIIPPGESIARVDYGDIAGAAQISEEYLLGRRQIHTEEIRRTVYERFGFDRMITEYVDSIHRTAAREPIGKEYSLNNSHHDALSISPWIVLGKSRLFHDYDTNYITDAKIVDLANFVALKQPRWDECIAKGFSANLLEKAYKLGVIEKYPGLRQDL